MLQSLARSRLPILNQDGTANTPSNPAMPGSIVSIYAADTGPLASPIADGAVTPISRPYILIESPPQVTFAGVNGNVVWAGSAPGLDREKNSEAAAHRSRA